MPKKFQINEYSDQSTWFSNQSSQMDSHYTHVTYRVNDEECTSGTFPWAHASFSEFWKKICIKCLSWCLFLNTSLAIYGLLKSRSVIKKSEHLRPSHLVSRNVTFANGITLYTDPLNHWWQDIGNISFKPHASFRPKPWFISSVFLVSILIDMPFHIPCNAGVWLRRVWAPNAHIPCLYSVGTPTN